MTIFEICGLPEFFPKALQVEYCICWCIDTVIRFPELWQFDQVDHNYLSLWKTALFRKSCPPSSLPTTRYPKNNGSIHRKPIVLDLWSIWNSLLHCNLSLAGKILLTPNQLSLTELTESYFFSIVVNNHILRFHISMHDSKWVSIMKTFEYLIKIIFAIPWLDDRNQFAVIGGCNVLENQTVNLTFLDNI